MTSVVRVGTVPYLKNLFTIALFTGTLVSTSSCSAAESPVSRPVQGPVENFTDGAISGGGLAYYLVIHRDQLDRSRGQLFFVFQDGNVQTTWKMTGVKLHTGSNFVATNSGTHNLTIARDWKSLTLTNCHSYMRNVGPRTCTFHWIQGPVRTVGPTAAG